MPDDPAPGAVPAPVDLAPVVVPRTLARLRPLLPPPPARIVEAGCGGGALAAALAVEGYRVLGVDPDEQACAEAAGRGVEVVRAGIAEVTGVRCDAVLFTRSLHHVDDLDATVAHAAGLVEPGGVLVLEEFAREDVDTATAGFLYDIRALLVAAGALVPPDGHEPVAAVGDPLDRWERERGALAEVPLHTGARMVEALAGAGLPVEARVATEMLWRLVALPGSRWRLAPSRVAGLLETVREQECRRIAEATLRPIGMVVSARVQSRPSSVS